MQAKAQTGVNRVYLESRTCLREDDYEGGDGWKVKWLILS